MVFILGTYLKLCYHDAFHNITMGCGYGYNTHRSAIRFT